MKALHRSAPVRAVTARPRLIFSTICGVLALVALPDTWAHQPVPRGILAWNIGCWLYLALSLTMMFRSTHERMQRRALDQDAGQRTVLALVLLAAVMSLGAIVAELAVAKDLTGPSRLLHIAFAAVTILSSWLLTQVMFAQHYAHDFYLAEARQGSGGLAFPGGHAPDYGDFLYFACVIGTSGQTADVSFTTRAMRRTGLFHCVLSYFFNATVLALTINIASGLV
ncbi:MAG TPA: DUF1345 domain-containing protein [Rhodocyclaceae bacterium]|nr:DUF1345 domain-containing protein [Rhodocyclaceae bacterium]HNA69029.1 DUF1345 domain-containing protein [Rhodocyclaceae bacterium]HNB64707.1 DUF1345 domain-containing protein [Rhodocyclaceae bacterium]HND23256.1 DUF1345 domain-containing protein [Rhodocyclaceae bacterium]HNI83261.1 DUF1345 domain-containing protein [Rhodocyclaceae bacterium]